MWYLSFDCATKTLAYSVVYLGDVQPGEAQPRGEVRLLDGAVVDLFPGRADASIHTVERIRAVSNYVEDAVCPKIEGKSPLKVLVEYQLGANAHARAASDAIIARLCAHDVVLVGPSLKNKVALTPDGEWSKFAAKYANNYLANKAHAKHNFAHCERIYGSTIPPCKLPGKSAAESRGHIADSVMQVFGYAMYGGTEPKF